jgi:predicted nucleotidyltransferase
MIAPRIERNLRQLAATFDDDITSTWLCGSRANGETTTDADWDLLVFGKREVAEALERGRNFFGRDVDLRFVDLARHEIKRLWRSAAWEDFASWSWTELSPSEAEYHGAKLSEQLVSMGGEWVEAGTLSVTRKKALRLWPEISAEPPLDPAVN